MPPIIILFKHSIPHRKLLRTHLLHKLLVKSNETIPSSHLKHIHIINVYLNFKNVPRDPLTFL